MFDDIHVCIGMDLLPALVIVISGLAMDWEDQTGPIIPITFDPNPYTPNESPYGTPKEHNYIMKQIQPYVDANLDIDPRSHCNLSGSTICLPVKSGSKPVYRRQYPIA
jgi:hypothetical protein